LLFFEKKRNCHFLRKNPDRVEETAKESEIPEKKLGHAYGRQFVALYSTWDFFEKGN